MNFYVLLPLAGATCALALFVGTVIYRPRSVPQWSFLLGTLLLAVERLCQMASLQAVSMEQMLAWQRWSLVSMALLPVAWLVFSLTYARGNAPEFLRRWLPFLALFGVAPVALAVWQWQHTVTEALWTPQAGHWVFGISLAGKALHVALVIGAVLIVMNLEWTFRAAVGTARWKVKYTVMALALLFGERIYTSSQVILYSAGRTQAILTDSVVVILACLLLAFSLYRSKFAHIDIYPSATALHKSLSVLLAGAYLVIVGLLARLVTALGGGESFPSATLFVLVALVGLGVLSFSDRARQAIRRFVSRHFQRPFHDYRRVWSAFTQRTTAVLDRQAFAREVARLISDTFEVLSVTLWLADSTTGRLTVTASTSLEAARAPTAALPVEMLRNLSASAGNSPHPVDIERSRETWCEMLRERNPSFFPQGGNRFCLPLVSGGEAVGLIVLGDRVRGVPFSTEDLELLACLGDHIAAGLRNLGLSEKLVRARELEAFQAMSAFLVHDLKNTASTLSLTLRNLPRHFENPAFREDALRTLDRSVTHINELIARLTTLRQKLELNCRFADVNQVVAAALQTVGDMPQITVVRQCPLLPPLPMDVKQVESVVVNLLLNAREAMSAGGEIRVDTGLQDGGAFVAVQDNGCGISSEFMADSLFKPFRTTKKSGLGIGMFQAKAIIEAHGGRIAVRSEPGKGTTVRFWLPLAAAAKE